MYNLFMTIVCSTTIALILKYNDIKNGEPLILLGANYLTASLISLIFLLRTGFEISTNIILAGILLGFLFVVSFFAFARAVSLAGTALASVSSRLSVIVPLLLSIIVFNELPNTWQISGFVFAFITIFLFYLSLKNNEKQKTDIKKYIYLLAVLIGIGINDFSMKIFEQASSESYKPLFLLSIFFSAFIYCLVYIIYNRIELKKNTVLSGVALGIPNVFSTYFLIGALVQLPAVIVFPFVNIGIIIATSFLAAVIFKEKLNRYALLSLFSGIVAIIFLSI